MKNDGNSCHSSSTSAQISRSVVALTVRGLTHSVRQFVGIEFVSHRCSSNPLNGGFIHFFVIEPGSIAHCAAWTFCTAICCSESPMCTAMDVQEEDHSVMVALTVSHNGGRPKKG